MFCVFQRCGLKRPRSVFFFNERDTGKTAVGYGQTSLSFQPADQTNISPNTRGESLRNWDTDACSLWRCLTIKKLWNFQYLPTAGQPGPGKGELSEEVASKYGANGWVIVLDSCGLTNRYLVPYEHVYRSADMTLHLGPRHLKLAMNFQRRIQQIARMCMPRSVSGIHSNKC